jgi:non-ribosomal peptide synthetase component E (peptide arylation enzyme)
VLRHPDVRLAPVVAVPDNRLGERIGIAVVTSRPDLTLDEIGRTVTEAGLSRYKRPERLVIVDALPTNPTGKVNKGRLSGLFRR